MCIFVGERLQSQSLLLVPHTPGQDFPTFLIVDPQAFRHGPSSSDDLAEISFFICSFFLQESATTFTFYINSLHIIYIYYSRPHYACVAYHFLWNPLGSSPPGTLRAYLTERRNPISYPISANIEYVKTLVSCYPLDNCSVSVQDTAWMDIFLQN